MNSDPVSLIMKSDFWIYKSFEAHMALINAMTEERVRDLIERRDSGTLADSEKASYSIQAFDWQCQQEDEEYPITINKVIKMVVAIVTAAVDTTASVIAWNIVHLVQNLDAQERV